MLLSINVQKRMSQGSFIRKMFEEGNELKRKYGEDKVFDLSIGNPILEPPKEFIDELRTLINSAPKGIHRYMENAGYAETRAAVASQLSKEVGLTFTENDIVMTCGSAGALNVVFKSILNPNDEVIVFSPFFTEFANYIDNHGGIMRIVSTDDKFIPKLDELNSAINQKTKAVLINSPNNPTGIIYNTDFITELTSLLKKKSEKLSTPIFLINDEAYRKLIFDNLEFPHIFNHYLQSITVNSHSKDLALAGERIGYIAIHPKCQFHDEIMSSLIFCNRILGFVNAPALMQLVIKKLQDVTVSVKEYQRKRDFLYNNLIEMGYKVIKPQGTFYIFPKSPIDDDIAFTSELRKWNVLTVPGSGFGRPGYFRIAYCVEDRMLEGSLTGFKNAAKKFNLI